MEAARHELVTLHGLVAHDGAAPDHQWPIDTKQTIALLDAVLTQPSDTGSQPS